MDSFGGDSLGSASGSIRLDASQALGSLGQFSRALKNVDTQSRSQGKGILAWASDNEQALNTIGTGILGVGAAFLGTWGLATKTAMDFDAQISAVGSVAGASKDQLAALREEALRLGADTTFSASEAAAGMEIMLKAGASLESVLNGGTEAVLNLSAATGVDVPLAAETAATAMNVFGVSAEEAANIIAQSANASSLDVNDWALALKSVGPVAASLGLDMEDLSQALVLLGDAGIKGEVAGTALRNILMGLADPAGEAALGLAELGIATHDAQGNFRGLEAITHDLAGSWGDMDAAQKLQIATMIAGEQGAASFMAIMDAQTEAVENNGDAFQDASKRMKATGTVSEQAAARMDNLKGSVEQLKGTVETVAITFTSGLAPAMRFVVDGVNKLLQGVLALPGPMKTVIGALTGLAGAAGVGAGAFLLLLPRIAEFKKAMDTLGGDKGSVGLLTKSMGLFMNPVGLAVVGVAALAAGFIYLYTHSEAFRELINTLGRTIDAFTGGAISKAIDKIKEFYEIFQLAFGGGDVNKNVNVTTTFDGDAYYIKETWLPDGTKAWEIREKNGDGYFGRVIQSYTGKGGETWILIEGKDGPFWTTVNNATGEIADPAEIPITANPEKFYRTRDQLMADGTTKTIVVDADDKPAGTVIRTLLENPLLGTKKVIIELGNGQQFIATVDSTTGQIINSREITITADTSKAREEMTELERRVDNVRTKFAGLIGLLQLGELGITRAFEALNAVLIVYNDQITIAGRIVGDVASKFATFVGPIQEIGTYLGIVKDLLTGDWESISWEDVFDVLGLGLVAEAINAVSDALDRLNRTKNDPNGDGLIEPHEQYPNDVGEPQQGFMSGGFGPKGGAGFGLDTKGGGLIDQLNALVAANKAAWAIIVADTTTGATGARTVADTQFGGMAQSLPPVVSGVGTVIGSTFAGIAAAVLSRSAEASLAAITNFTALQGGVTAQSSIANVNASGAFGSLAASVGGAVAGLQSGVSSRMASLQAAVTSQASSANQNATSQFSSMAATSGSHFRGMQAAAALQMALMASGATTQGNATMSNMVGALAGGMARVAWTAMGFVTAISSAGGAAANAAYSAGANVSQGFANGMLAYLGVIQGAAAAMVAAAAAAVTAKAMISSPSRLFRGYGAFIGEGFEIGIRSSIPDVARASAALVGAGVPSPTVLSTMYGGYGGGGSQYIDRSTHVTNNIALTESDLLRLTQSADLARAVARHMSDPDASAQYGGA